LVRQESWVVAGRIFARQNAPSIMETTVNGF
jgi:hypothetical protein